jgi:hypothetical protein
MVKTTKFDHHPVEIHKGLMTGEQDFAGQTMLEIIDALLASGSLTAGWGQFNLVELCNTAGIDIPEGAAAVIVDVKVRDDGSTAAEIILTFGYGGLIDATNFPGRSLPVYCGDVNDRWDGQICILPFDEDGVIDTLNNASGGNTLDYQIRLIGWLILGTDYTLPTSPQEDLACGFIVRP